MYAFFALNPSKTTSRDLRSLLIAVKNDADIAAIFSFCLFQVDYFFGFLKNLPCYEITNHNVVVVSFNLFEKIDSSSTSLSSFYCSHHAPSFRTLVIYLPGPSLLVNSVKLELKRYRYTFLRS